MKATALAALFTLSLPVAAADIKGELPCRFQAGLVSGTATSARVFTTNTHENAHKGFKTSVGALTWAHNDMHQSVPVINGKKVSISKQNIGSFGNGKVHDLGGKILISYQVVRMEDSRAEPSNLTLLVGPNGKVIEEHIVEGNKAREYPCSLVN